MTKIEFTREERPCPHNEELRAKGYKGPQILYDYAVVIDGERRATWTRQGREYWLRDLMHGDILLKDGGSAWYSERVVAARIDDFEPVISSMLHRIPTLEQYRQRREHEARVREAARQDALKTWKANRVKSCAPQLLEVVQTLKIAAGVDGWPDGWGLLRERVECALAAATTDRAEERDFLAAYDEEHAR